MRRLLWLAGLGLASPTIAQTCEPSAARHAVKIEPNRPGASPHPVVYGKNRFTQTLENGWTFALLPSAHGWNLQLTDKPVDTPGAVDMSAITPPFGGVPPNPRDIAGWHFRNAENTGPNMGEVNAPQDLRRFFFDESLIGTGGFRPPRGSNGLVREPADDEGTGWLLIRDYGLADLAKGQKARMSYMEFDACLTWPKSRADQADDTSPTYTVEERELAARCGLDLELYEMDARLLPRQLGGDIDGDGAGDEVVQITRKSDSRHGLAICRASTWIETIGIDQPIETPAFQDYLPLTEAWEWLPANSDLEHTGMPDTTAWPDADGDILLLERRKKQAVAIYWKDGELRTKELFHLVTE